MDDCCESESASTGNRRATCPECGTNALRVTREPVAFYAMDASRVISEWYYFCATRGCNTVYFDAAGNRFTRDDIRVRFGMKEEKGPRLVCYCFGHTEEAIEAELRVHGKTTIPERIRAEITANTCECEMRNPKGRCCLGDVAQAMKRISTHRKGAR